MQKFQVNDDLKNFEESATFSSDELEEESSQD